MLPGAPCWCCLLAIDHPRVPGLLLSHQVGVWAPEEVRRLAVAEHSLLKRCWLRPGIVLGSRLPVFPGRWLQELSVPEPSRLLVALAMLLPPALCSSLCVQCAP